MSLIVRSLALAVAALLPVACLSEDPRPAIDGPPRDTAADPDAGTEPSADGPAPEGPPVAVEAGATGETGSPEATTPAPDAGPSGDDGGVEPDVSPDLRPDVTPIGPLLAHWPLDEGMGTTVADVSPNGNGGMVVGGAAWTPSGWPGAMFPNPGALVFDGVDDFVELGLRTIPPVEVPKTISTWFWLEAPAGMRRKNLVALTNLGDETGVQLGLDAGRAAVWLMGDELPMLVSTTPVAAGWHHLAYTFDGTTHQLFLDNTSVGTIVRAPKPGEVLKARLGAYDLMDEMFAGRIDDVRIYDRALDAAGITALATGRTP